MNKNLNLRECFDESKCFKIDGRNIQYTLETASDYLYAKHENWSSDDLDAFIDNNFEQYQTLNQVMALKQSCFLLRHTSHTCGSLADGLFALKNELISKLKKSYNFDFDDKFVEDFKG